MYSDEDFYEMQPCASGITLTQNDNKSSVLCPETQDITSKYLVLQQLDAHQKMIARAKGVVDTSAPKSMQSYISVTSQRKKKLLKNYKNDPSSTFHIEQQGDSNRPSSSRLSSVNTEDEVESTSTSLVNKAIQVGIPVSNLTSKTAEKISWYLEALSLGELQPQYFSVMDNYFASSKLLGIRNPSYLKDMRCAKGDIMDRHKEHFIAPKKPFSPRLLANRKAESKVKKMDCYNPPFRKKRASSTNSYDTFESYEEDDEADAQFSEGNENTDTSDHSLVEEETLINRKQPEINTSQYNPTPSVFSQYKRNYMYSNSADMLNQNEEEKYLEFLSKVTEDILRSGVYSDRAIQQAFEFHMQFYKDESNKEKLQSLLEQVLHGLKISNDDNEENFQQSSSLFPLSRPNTPPEKETSGVFSQNGTLKTGSEYNSSEVNESIDNSNFANS